MKKFRIKNNEIPDSPEWAVWLSNRNKGDLLGVYFCRAPHHSDPFTIALATLYFENLIIHSVNININVGYTLYVEVPRENIVWRDDYKAKLQRDITVAYLRWPGHDPYVVNSILNNIRYRMTIRRWYDHK